MEAEQKIPAWLNPEHPNHERWERGRKLSRKRAVTVQKIIASARECRNLHILDLGSGEGGTSALFAEQNSVISFDLSLLRLQRQKSLTPIFDRVKGFSGHLPFRDESFDLIILQDVIEHIQDREQLVKELKRVLREKGLIFISTPNKYSFINILADPHWGIPLLALFKRPAIKKFFLRYFRKKDHDRNDIAQLLSLAEVKSIFDGFGILLKTREVVKIFSEQPEGILWSNFHLFLYKLLQKTGLISVIKKSATNKEGFINNYFTPAFYALLQKDTR